MYVRTIAALSLTALSASISGHLQEVDDRTSLQVRAAIDRGAYAEAVATAERLVAATEKARGASALETADALDLLSEGLIGAGRSAAADTLQSVERALDIKTRQLPPADPGLAATLHNLAALRLERGELTAALTASRRALAIRVAGSPPGSSLIADSLDRTGDALMQLERFDEARQTLARALVIREARAGAEPLPLARTLERAAWLDRFGGDSASARARLARARTIRRAQPEPHPDESATAVLAGDLDFLAGRIREARDIWVEGAAGVRRTFGGAHPLLVALGRRIVLANDVLGERDAAREVMNEIVPLTDRVLAPCNVDGLAVRAYGASRLAYEGDYIGARTGMRRTQTTIETCLGPLSTRTATVVYNRALLAARMGDYTEARRLHHQTIDVWSRALGPSHVYVARGWEGLGDVDSTLGQYAGAQASYLRALSARRSATTVNAAQVAATLTSLARSRMALSQLQQAERHLAEALAIFEKGGVADEPDAFARALTLRGEVARRRHDEPAARASFAAALTERERVFGASHPLAAQARADVATASLRLHEYGSALRDALAAEAAGRDHLRFTIRYLPERQAMQYAASRPRGLDVAISTGVAMATAGPDENTAMLLDAVVRSRGVILEELATRARTTLPQTAAMAPLAARAAAARQRYANLVVRTLQQSAPRGPREALPRQQLDEARREKEEAEQALAEQSATDGVEMARTEAGLEAVRAALTADAALVSFVRYEQTPANAMGARALAPTPSYAAFVLRPDRAAPVLAPLGSAAAIERLVAEWRREASGQSLIAGATAADAERSYRLAGARLRRAIWDPLGPALAGATRVFIVPDGQLNVVNVAALPTVAGRFLADESVLLHYVSTERDLAMPAATAAAGALLAVGGATFDGRTAPPSSAPAARSACEEFGRMRFPALPGSRREVADIAAAWPSADASEVTVLSGTAATETAVKRAVSGRRVVHLATHGFFLGGECVPGMAGTRGVGGLASRRSSASDADNPLLLSGLALAWANRRDKARTSEDDGILTAEEIASLNLQGTEWAVLSACDTGLGEIKAGEGVFGLRRAFQVAGARTVIMSLWSVDDTAARVWMRALYDGRFQQGLATADAVRHASRTVLADRRAKRLTTHPFYWAGFVAAGDWR